MQLYGICLERMNIKSENLVNMLREYDKDVYHSFYEDMTSVGDTPYTDDDVFDWFDHYDSEGCYGLGAFLHDYVKEKEGISLDMDDPDAFYLGIEARLPWEYPDEIRNMSEEQFDEILRKIVNMISDDELEIRWWFVEDQD